jgi:hypothetical protein
MTDRQDAAENETAERDSHTGNDAQGEHRVRTRWQGSRRRFLGTTAGVVGLSTTSMLGTSGHSVGATQQDQWTDPPVIDREFDFDTGGPAADTVSYEHDADPAEARFELTGTAAAGPDGNATGAWRGQYDGQGNELDSTTIYDPNAGYPVWRDWFYRVSSLRLGLVENTSGDPEALYATLTKNHTEVQWTTTFADDIDWTDDRFDPFSSLAVYNEVGPDQETWKIATAGGTDPVAHDDWINNSDGTVTRNITVSDPNIDRVDSVDHYFDKPWLYMFGIDTDGGVFAQAASPNNQAEWQTSLAEFDEETFVAGSFNPVSDSAYVIASDDAGAGDYIKTIDNDGNVTNSATFTPPTDADSAVGGRQRFLESGYFTIGQASNGWWIREIAGDLSVNWTTTLDGSPPSNVFFAVRDFGGSDDDGFLVVGRQNDAPAFWRLAPDGTVQWDATLGSDPEDFLFPLGVGPESALVLGGGLSTGDGGSKPWLARVNSSDGTVEWQTTYGGAAWGNPSSPEEAGDGLVFADRGESTVEVLELSPPGGPPALPGFDSAPQDLNGDGLYRDVDGDGSFDIFDVQAFFNTFNSDVVQNNVDAFDFDDDGSVDIFDVQQLFEDLQEEN